MHVCICIRKVMFFCYITSYQGCLKNNWIFHLRLVPRPEGDSKNYWWRFTKIRRFLENIVFGNDPKMFGHFWRFWGHGLTWSFHESTWKCPQKVPKMSQNGPTRRLRMPANFYQSHLGSHSSFRELGPWLEVLPLLPYMAIYKWIYLDDIHGMCKFFCWVSKFIHGTLTGGLEHEWIRNSISYMGYHPNPIELHHFSADG